MSKGMGRDWLFDNYKQFKEVENYNLKTEVGLIPLPRYYKDKLKRWRVIDDEYMEKIKEIAEDNNNKEKKEIMELLKKHSKTLEGRNKIIELKRKYVKEETIKEIVEKKVRKAYLTYIRKLRAENMEKKELDKERYRDEKRKTF